MNNNIIQFQSVSKPPTEVDWTHCAFDTHRSPIRIHVNAETGLDAHSMCIAVPMWMALKLHNTCMFLSMHFHPLFQCWSGSLAKKQVLLSSRTHHNCSKNRLLSEAWACSTGSTGWECWHSSHQKVFHNDARLLVNGVVKEKQRSRVLVQFLSPQVAELPSIGCDHCLKKSYMKYVGLKQKSKARYWLCRECHNNPFV